MRAENGVWSLRTEEGLQTSYLSAPWAATNPCKMAEGGRVTRKGSLGANSAAVSVRVIACLLVGPHLSGSFGD